MTSILPLCKRLFFISILICFGGQSFGQTVHLGLNLKQGEDYGLNTTSVIKMKQNFNGQEINTEMTVEGDMNFAVTDIRNDLYKVDAQYERMKMAMGMANNPMASAPQKMEFSSENVDSTDAISGILASVTDKNFQLSLSKTGEITQVENLSKLWEESIDKSAGGEAMKSQMRIQLLKNYGEKALKGNIEMTTHIYPGHPVKKGDQWSIRTELNSTFKAQINTDYTLAEIAEDHYVIKGNSTIETYDDNAYTEQNGMNMKYNLDGTMNSEIKVDRKTGWIIKSTIKQKLSGNIKVKSPQMPSEIDMPITMTNHMTVTN